MFYKSIFIACIIFTCCKNSKSVTSSKLPYALIDEQRKALVNKVNVIPIRILDSSQIVNDIKYLAGNDCLGRKPGTVGHLKAYEYILNSMRVLGLDSLENSMVQTFAGTNINGTTIGKNILGYVKGTQFTQQYIVVTAHYDHLGVKTNGTYFGADDNASGVACLIAMAKYFKLHPHKYSIIFAALDREETGLEGAYNLVDFLKTKLTLVSIKFNLNMDMISRSNANEIFVSGLSHNPEYKKFVDEIQPKTNVKVLMGHDAGSLKNDWTNQSDHSAFHQKNIPFLYFGMEDHADYHAPTDTFDKINISFYIENCNIIATFLKILTPL